LNIYALVTGVVTAVIIIFYFRRKKLEPAHLPYPILLASFPLYYFAFALYASDYVALYKEVGLGIPFIALAYFATRSNRIISSYLVAIGCLTHAAYDVFHDIVFINPGTPVWWLEFCGSIDLILACYLIYFAIKSPNKALS